MARFTKIRCPSKDFVRTKIFRIAKVLFFLNRFGATFFVRSSRAVSPLKSITTGPFRCKGSKGVSQEWRFYEAEFVKTRCENSLCFIFDGRQWKWSVGLGLWIESLLFGGRRSNQTVTRSGNCLVLNIGTNFKISSVVLRKKLTLQRRRIRGIL